MPQQLSASEFWDRYLRSDYYRRDKGNGGVEQNSADLFMKYEERLQRSSLNADRAPSESSRNLVAGVDPDFDLTSTYNEVGFVEGKDLEDGEMGAAAAFSSLVLEKFNRSSLLVVASTGRDVVSSHAPSGVDEEELREVRSLQQDDCESGSLYQPLHTRPVQSSKKRRRSLDLNPLFDAVRYPSDFTSIFPSSENALKVTLECCSCSDDRKPKSGEAVDEVSHLFSKEHAKELEEVYVSVTDLLRHFYSRLNAKGTSAAASQSADADDKVKLFAVKSFAFRLLAVLSRFQDC